MYYEFSNWFTDLDSFKLGMTFGSILGILIYFIICAIVEYAIDLFNKKRVKKRNKKK